MSIFTFLADVGDKLFHHGDTPTANTNQQQASSQVADDSDTMAEQLTRKIEQLALGINSPNVTVQDGKATLSGDATSQEAMEKAVLALGNTLGISEVNSQITVPPQTAVTQSQFYTVKPGDTLSKISKECYGNANLYDDIFKANQPLLTSPDKIYPGQQLRIPQIVGKAA